MTRTSTLSTQTGTPATTREPSFWDYIATPAEALKTTHDLSQEPYDFSKDIEEIVAQTITAYQDLGLVTTPAQAQTLSATIRHNLQAFTHTRCFRNTAWIMLNTEGDDRFNAYTNFQEVATYEDKAYFNDPDRALSIGYPHQIMALQHLAELSAIGATGYMPPTHMEAFTNFLSLNFLSHNTAAAYFEKNKDSFSKVIPQQLKEKISASALEIAQGKRGVYIADQSYGVYGYATPPNSYGNYNNFPSYFAFKYIKKVGQNTERRLITNPYDASDMITSIHENNHIDDILSELLTNPYNESGDVIENSDFGIQSFITEYGSYYIEKQLKLYAIAPKKERLKETRKLISYMLVDDTPAAGGYPDCRIEYNCKDQTWFKNRVDMILKGLDDGRDVTPDMVQTVMALPNDAAAQAIIDAVPPATSTYIEAVEDNPSVYPYVKARRPDKVAAARKQHLSAGL